MSRIKDWTEEEKQAYRAQLKKAQASRHPENFQHFASEVEREAFRQGVKNDQDSGKVPF